MVEIKYLTYQQINKTKWDACIDNAENGLVYAYSFYLDAMSKNWDALVLNDYEAVMPLTWNKKYSIPYLYQPPFTACLGIFARRNLYGKSLNAATLSAFLQSVPAKFKYWDIYLNPGNLFQLKDFNLYERMNYVLDLNAGYETLYKAYRDNIKRNIKKSEQFQLSIHKDVSFSEVVSLAKEQRSKFSPIADDDFIRFEKLFLLLYNKQKATTYGVYTKEKQLIASAVFLFSHNRAYYIMVGNHPNARAKGSSGRSKTPGASHALINAFIKDHAGQNMLLDFEGSDIPSLAFFYSGFGATEEKYSAVKLNKLPAALKWLKK